MQVFLLERLPARLVLRRGRVAFDEVAHEVGVVHDHSIEKLMTMMMMMMVIITMTC